MENSSGKFTYRKTNVVNRTQLGTEYIRPEEILIKLEGSRRNTPIDVGCWCYRKRGHARSRPEAHRRGERLVDLSTFDKGRRELVARFLDRISVSGLRDESILSEIKYITSALDWIDSFGHEAFYKNEEAAFEAYKGYSNYLNGRIRGDGFSPNSACRLQRALLSLVRLMLPSSATRVKHSIPAISESRGGVAAPSSKSVSHAISILVPFMRALRTAVMHDDYPFRITTSNLDISLFPMNKKRSYNHKLEEQEPTSVYSIYDMKSGKVMSFQEYWESVQEKWKNPAKTLPRGYYKKSKELLAKANKDKLGSRFRAIEAQKVIKLYAYILQTIMGANSSALVNLEWAGALEISEGSVKKDFRTLKFRSSGKVETYPIGGKQGLKLLREYLEFREWYLGKRKCKYLFFSDFSNSKSQGVRVKPKRMEFTYATSIREWLHNTKILDKSAFINSTQARKYKNTILKRLGANTKEAAEALNHSERVNELHYSQIHIDDVEAELSGYWEKVIATAKSISLSAERNKNSETDIPSGSCRDTGNPQSSMDRPPIEPSCSTQYGCLYCKNYVCHADVEDISKLLCLLYVIEAVRDSAEEAQRAEEMFRPLIVRINSLLSRMIDLYPELSGPYEKAYCDVFDRGILIPFWENRLQRYEAMGVCL